MVAQNLDVRGVFGVPSNEYLNYAMNNRMEREEKGVEVARPNLKLSCDVLAERPRQYLLSFKNERVNNECLATIV